MQDTMSYAGLFLVVWVLSAVGLVSGIGLGRTEAPLQLGIPSVMLLAYVAFFTTPLLIVLIHFTGGTQPDTIYGALAIILRRQQVPSSIGLSRWVWACQDGCDRFSTSCRHWYRLRS